MSPRPLPLQAKTKRVAAASEAELRRTHIADTGLSEGALERFLLPDAEDLAAEREGPPNLASLKTRIGDIIGA